MMAGSLGARHHHANHFPPMGRDEPMAGTNP